MYSFVVSWKVRSNSSSIRDASHSTTVRANNEHEAIAKVKQSNLSMLDRLYGFVARRV